MRLKTFTYYHPAQFILIINSSISKINSHKNRIKPTKKTKKSKNHNQKPKKPSKNTKTNSQNMPEHTAVTFCAHSGKRQAATFGVVAVVCGPSHSKCRRSFAWWRVSGRSRGLELTPTTRAPAPAPLAPDARTPGR